MKKYTNVIIILLVVMTLYTIMVVAVSKNENKNKDKDKDSQNNPTNPNNPNNPNDPNQGGSDPKEDNKSVSYIIMSPNTIISYSNGKWSEKKNYDYVNKQFDVYDETGKLGNYQLQKSNDKWHVKDASNNFIDYTGNLFAITGDYEYNNVDYLKEDLKLIGKLKSIEANFCFDGTDKKDGRYALSHRHASGHGRPARER